MQSGSGKPSKILIVEDDAVDKKLLQRLLSESSLRVSKVECAESLAGALELLDKSHFDIVLPDLNLPDSRGLNTLARISEKYPDAAIVVITGECDEELGLKAIGQGAQEYLIKGKFDIYALNNAIRYAIERKNIEQKLRLARETYRIFENSAVAVIMVDKNERLVSWNKFTESFLGMSKEDLHLKSVRSLYPEGEWERIKSHDVGQEGLYHHLETRMLKKNRQPVDVDTSLSTLRNSKGKIIGSIGIITDITERKRAEQALIESEEKYRKQFEEALDAILIADAETGVIIDCNPAALELLGREKKELVGEHQRILHPPEDIEGGFSGSFKHHLGENEGQAIETQVITKNGEIKDVSIKASLFELGGKKVLQGIFRDITEHKRISEILERKQKNLEAIFDAAPVGMLLIDENMIVRRVNNAISRMVHKDYSEIINRRVGNTLGCIRSTYNEKGCGYSRACATCPLEKTVRAVFNSGQSVHEVEIHATLQIDNREVTPWLSISAEPAIIDGLKRVVVAIDDITGRKKAEEKLRETMEMKSQFVSTVSHELRTPLACVKEAIEVILGGAAGKIKDKQRNFLGIAKRNIDRLVLLINDVLDFQKLEAGRMRLDIHENEISEVVGEVHKTMVTASQNKGIELSFKVDDGLPKVRFDSDKIIQVLTNLVSNAIKFTAEGGKVSVRVQLQGEELVIRVSDTGMGIPKEALPKIFERFYRVQRPGKQIPGTGLGLAIVKKIVTMHAGRIEVESEVDKGTTFTVFLPLDTKSAPEVLSPETDEILEDSVANSND